jgi:surfactin synthase thioesterase subunit
MEKIPSTLICVPFAGAGASFYHGWTQAGFSDLSVVPVNLPGRERLIGEEPFVDLLKAADALAGEALASLGPDSAVVFGHCFLGSVLAYEITRRMLRDRPGSVCELIVSASRVPAISRPIGVDGMSDDEFLDHVKSTTGFTHPAMEIPEMRELLLPTLRADFTMDETYRFAGETPLEIPITAIAAGQDRMVTRDDVAGWKRYTADTFRLVDVSGGHMYLAEDPRELFEVLSDRVCALRETVDAA